MTVIMSELLMVTHRSIFVKMLNYFEFNETLINLFVKSWLADIFLLIIVELVSKVS